MTNSASDHAYAALGELQAIDVDDVPSSLQVLLDEQIERVEDLAIELEIAEDDSAE